MVEEKEEEDDDLFTANEPDIRTGTQNLRYPCTIYMTTAYGSAFPFSYLFVFLFGASGEGRRTRRMIERHNSSTAIHRHCFGAKGYPNTTFTSHNLRRSHTVLVAIRFGGGWVHDTMVDVPGGRVPKAVKDYWIHVCRQVVGWEREA